MTGFVALVLFDLAPGQDPAFPAIGPGSEGTTQARAPDEDQEGTGAGTAPSITTSPSGVLTPIDATRSRGMGEYRLM